MIANLSIKRIPESDSAVQLAAQTNSIESSATTTEQQQQEQDVKTVQVR